MDEFGQSQLILAVSCFVSVYKNRCMNNFHGNMKNNCKFAYQKGGKFIAKIFRGKDTSLLYCQLKLFFPTVTYAKPKSSRNSSIEAFAVCENDSPPEGFNPRDLYRLLEKVGSPSGGGSHLGKQNLFFTSSSHQTTKCIPFLACGDLTGYDSDRSYPLPKEADGSSYQSLDPVQSPIAPPYKRAQESFSTKHPRHMRY
ncbi:unnamed protein product [Eruca vesicaria subsp. sativa]|uniref:Ribosomal RNA methyltransferase FtsJ domain-containing protein n=1 Tax=Eruca vesicaria subsp. sativa TaxID=29727 RepID=A0ABC8JPH1_ERUVS|nr:unnamed protein product [Eruca vesicaria subsp. sativa]